MKKNYIYLLILLVATVGITFMLSNLYKREETKTSYLYEKLNKITSTEFDEYMIEHPDTIIYVADQNNLENNKFEKKFYNKLEKLNLLENIIYIEKNEINSSLQKKLKEEYSYKYNEKDLSAIIVISDGIFVESTLVDESSNINTIINYEVFE